jgi:hypothetical protein
MKSGIVQLQAISFLAWKPPRCFKVCDQVINDFVDDVRIVESVIPFHAFHKDWFPS